MSNDSRPPNQAIRILQILGGCLFVAAYFLPSISFPDEARGLIGYKCAYFAITTTFGSFWDICRGREPWREIWFPLLVGLSSLNNFLVPIYVLIKKARTRRLALAIIVSCVATPCAVFFGVHEHPVVGCYLWILGAILLMSPEVGRTGSIPAGTGDLHNGG